MWAPRACISYRTTYYNEMNPGPPTANVNLRRPFPQFGFIQLVAAASHCVL